MLGRIVVAVETATPLKKIFPPASVPHGVALGVRTSGKVAEGQTIRKMVIQSRSQTVHFKIDVSRNLNKRAAIAAPGKRRRVPSTTVLKRLVGNKPLHGIGRLPKGAEPK